CQRHRFPPLQSAQGWATQDLCRLQEKRGGQSFAFFAKGGWTTRESGLDSQNYSASSIASHPCKVRKDGPPRIYAGFKKSVVANPLRSLQRAGGPPAKVDLTLRTIVPAASLPTLAKCARMGHPGFMPASRKA